MSSKQLPSTSASTAWSECGRMVAVLPFAVAALMPLLAGAADGTVQCWRDDHNQRVCGDAVPPSDARRQHRFRRPGLRPRLQVPGPADRQLHVQHDVDEAHRLPRLQLRRRRAHLATEIERLTVSDDAFLLVFR